MTRLHLHGLFVAAALLTVGLSGGAAMAQSADTTRTLPNGDVVTNDRSWSNGTYQDQRTVTTPAGGSYSNDRTVGNGQYTDNRAISRPNGSSYDGTRTASNGTWPIAGRV